MGSVVASRLLDSRSKLNQSKKFGWDRFWQRLTNVFCCLHKNNDLSNCGLECFAIKPTNAKMHKYDRLDSNLGHFWPNPQARYPFGHQIIVHKVLLETDFQHLKLISIKQVYILIIRARLFIKVNSLTFKKISLLIWMFKKW